MDHAAVLGLAHLRPHHLEEVGGGTDAVALWQVFNFIKIRGKVYVYENGRTFTLDEPYIKEPIAYIFPKYNIPDGQYFVLGDNRFYSNDSRNYGLVARHAILGLVLR
jgi:signal peptidase I